MIAKELTKIHEEFFVDEIKNFKNFKNILKGELTLVISEESVEKSVFNKEKIVNKAKKYLNKYSLKDTVNLIIETENVNKKDIYKLCLDLKNEKIN